MLPKGFELRRREKGFDDFSGRFHLAIIASLLLLLGGCGYKTDPVYVPPTDQNQSVKAPR